MLVSKAEFLLCQVFTGCNAFLRAGRVCRHGIYIRGGIASPEMVVRSKSERCGLASRLAVAERDASSHVTHTQRCGAPLPAPSSLRSPRGSEPRRSLSSRTCTETPTARYSGRCSRLDTSCQVGSLTALASVELINTSFDHKAHSSNAGRPIHLRSNSFSSCERKRSWNEFHRRWGLFCPRFPFRHWSPGTRLSCT